MSTDDQTPPANSPLNLSAHANQWQQRQDGTWWTRDSGGYIWEYDPENGAPVFPPQPAIFAKPRQANGLAARDRYHGTPVLISLAATVAAVTSTFYFVDGKLVLGIIFAIVAFITSLVVGWREE